jgi:hypothetical protein
MKQFYNKLKNETKFVTNIHIFYYNLCSYFLYFKNKYLFKNCYLFSKINYQDLTTNDIFIKFRFRIKITSIVINGGYICMTIGRKNISKYNYSNDYFENNHIEQEYIFHKLISSRTILVPKNYYLDKYFHNKQKHKTIRATVNFYDIDDMFIYAIIEYDFYNKFISYLLMYVCYVIPIIFIIFFTFDIRNIIK